MLLRPICRMSPWSSTKTVSGPRSIPARFRNSTDPKIDDVEMVEAKISQVVMEGIHQLLDRKEREARICLDLDERLLSDIRGERGEI